MARLNIDTGIEGNPATGDTLRTAMTKINTNLLELYTDLAATTSSNGNLTNSDTNGDVKIFANGTGIVEIDRLSINNTTITGMDTNADLILAPNGTGGIVAQGVFTAGEIATNEITSNGSNANITLEPQGTGDILLKTGGQVGIGTVSSPDTSLHIKQSTATITLQRTNDANTPGIDFQSNGGNVRAKMYMDGTDGTNKEMVFENMDDSSMNERFRVTRTGASVTGTFNIKSDSDSTLSDATISMTENKITTLRSNDNLELGTSGTGTIELQANTNVTGTLTVTGATTISDALTATSLTTNDITSNGSNADITIDPQGTGDINLTSTADINIPTAVGLTFGSDTEKIENTSGNNLYLYAGTNIYLNAENDLHFDANGGDIVLKDNNTKFGQFSNQGSKLTIYSGPSSDAEITLGGAVLCENVSIKFTSLPTSNPGVAGRLWRDGTDLKISTG